MLFSLEGTSSSTPFPDPELAEEEPNGLLAVNGELSTERLLNAYRQGVFPWYSEDQPILWWSPNPRTVIYPSQLHVSRSLKKALKKGLHEITFDKAFNDVIKHCAEPREGDTGGWLLNEMIAAYTELHRLGHAHSVEVWLEGKLVGGLYGICIGSAFFGESMFSRSSNASKIAMTFLAECAEDWGFEVIDCQVHNSHLESLGAVEISRKDFLAILKQTNQVPNIDQRIWHTTSSNSAKLRHARPANANDNALRLFLSVPHPCNYIAEQTSSTLFIDPNYIMAMPTFNALAKLGFRRSGNMVYRQKCETCEQCRSVRIPINNFAARRSHRRIINKNSDLTRKIVPASKDPELFALYQRYTATRHADGEMKNSTIDEYFKFLRNDWCDTRFIVWSLGDKPICVAVTDFLDDGLSAVYTYFDPELSSRSLGTFAILQQIEITRSMDKPFVYLGFWVKDSQKMAYKTDYRPIEIFSDEKWIKFSSEDKISL